MSLDILELISDKRYGRPLTDDKIKFFVQGVVDRSLPDYQVAALLMALVLNGMNQREMTTLTLEMANSGSLCEFPEDLGCVVDKHSTGGVGDKCTLVILPMLSALGVPVAKLSGRGLGFTGGTIDKLESIKGFETSMSIATFVDRVVQHKVAIGSQTEELAPADKYLYALRDVTGTVDAIPLIASSIMSKKIAGGAGAIVLDVTCGSGAFMKDLPQARELCAAMSAIGRIVRRPVRCVITNMDQPLGFSVGNALEVMETITTLSGQGPKDLVTVCTTLAAVMLMLSDQGKRMSFEEATQTVGATINDGSAKQAFLSMIRAQGGKIGRNGIPSFVDHPKKIDSFLASSSGFLHRADAREIGMAAMKLGAGRRTKDDVLDMGAGIVLHTKVGGQVREGQVLADLYAGSKINLSTPRLREVQETLKRAFIIRDGRCFAPKDVLEMLL